MKKHIVKYVNLLMVLAIMITLLSCDQETTVDLGAPDQLLVVEGRIELVDDPTNQIHQIKLSVVGDFFRNEETPRASGAEVWVTTSDGARYDFMETNDGLYTNESLSPTLDEMYTLHIIWNGEEYEAFETLLSVPEIDAIYQQFEEGNLFEDEGIKIAIDFTDPAEVANYYFWETYLDGELQILPNPGNKNNLIANDEFFNGNQIEGYFPNEEVVFDPGDQVQVRQVGLSENGYNYYFTLFDQAGKTGALIDTPPIPVKGNVRNITNPNEDALGYFYASQVAEGVHIIE